jgi:glutathione S-transferase
MITIHGGSTTRSFRVLWLLEEMGIPYPLRRVDLLRPRDDAEFLKVNPAGFLPAMQDGGVAMVESIAIMEYLVARYGPTDLAPIAGDAAFPLYQQFLHLGEAGMATCLNIVVASRYFAPDAERDNWGARQAIQMFLNRLTLVSQRLEEVPSLAGQASTAADISVCYALELGSALGACEEYSAAVKSYLGRLRDRQAFQRAKKKSTGSAGAET